ncbi:MAG: CRISPR-associated endonuclease Cas2 [Bacteroidales bacterium]|nr:CRISPR-associated endonuclease Cas2 [Bacteroidales bacterium]
MPELRLNAYHIMWLFVFFDLPTETKQNRRDAGKFRKELEKDGFTMMQFSVYVRHCPSKENADVHVNRVRILMPPEGQVSILCITDKQYGEILNFNGKIMKSLPTAPRQLELF